MFKRNRIELTGNITKAAETKVVGEFFVARARLMHNETIRKADKTTVEQMVAVDLEIWGNRGKAFSEMVTSKSPVYVVGKLQLSQWEENGQKRSRLFVRVDDWQFIAAKPKDEGQPKSEAAPKAEKPKGKARAHELAGVAA